MNTYKCKFERPTIYNSYIRALAYVRYNDGCSRRDILDKVFGRVGRRADGNRSDMFTALIRNGNLRYDSAFGYHVTQTGLDLVESALRRHFSPAA